LIIHGSIPPSTIHQIAAQVKRLQRILAHQLCYFLFLLQQSPI
jgi:hypothetical protein